ncbi:YciI family protein [Streptomyces sp. NPDC051940]|uniref:YciI family protein n=1 Tax=Streptomyces sp. NPDC051940 TaxID=3155675 RepID=UPI00343A0397
MFVLDLTYTAPLDRVDAALDAHVAWLTGLYDDGVALASGRKNPREGGVIIAVAKDRAEIEALVAQDPFVTAGVATYGITEFQATKTAPQLAEFRQQLPG